jgi:hypothetical protein
MAGIQTLSPGVKCNNICSISLKDTTRGGDHVIKMYDGQCYYTKYIYMHIVNLIRKGYTVGHPNFIFPNRSPITLDDLTLLYLDPAKFPDMVTAWRASPAYAIEQAQLASDALAAAAAFADADTVFIDVIPDGRGKHVVDSVLRWGVQMDRDEFVELDVWFIKNVDHFLLPLEYDDRFDHNDDENIGRRRIRNIGLREIEYVGGGYAVPSDTPLVIRFNNDIYNTLEDSVDAEGLPIMGLATAMGKHPDEIRCNAYERIRAEPAEGGRRRKTKRNKRKRTRRRY